MVKVGKLWGDAEFNSLPLYSRFFYVFFCTQPSITTLGVVKVSLKRFEDDGLTPHEIEGGLIALEQSNYIYRIEGKAYDTFVVRDHFKSLAKSKGNIRKAKDEGKQSEGELLTVFQKMFTKEDFEDDTFVPPTPQEVSDYALTKGYIVSGKVFCDWYGSNDWYNKNDKKVRNWKRTLVNVWCKEDNKLIAVKGAPKGFEYFYTTDSEGERLYPEYWKDGSPGHSNFLYTQTLIEEYGKCNKIKEDI
tara:strand:- start:66757 stop:67494 length:738 start_codon:yes stop_codon:yes gene_type:complete